MVGAWPHQRSERLKWVCSGGSRGGLGTASFSNSLSIAVKIVVVARLSESYTL